MGQYYYRPVPSGYADVGRSVAAGITGGVGNYYAGKEDQRRRGIEAEDRTRRQTREDLDLDVMLASAGGGRGMAPVAPTIGRPEVGSALNDRRGISAAPGPDRSRDFTQMGDFYIEDPASRATRLEAGEFELTQGRAAAERGRRGAALGGAASALIGGSRSPEALGAFYEEGADPRMLLDDQGPQAPVRGTQAYMDMLEDEADIAQRYRGDADDEDEMPEIGSIEFNRVFSIVESMAEERNPEGYVTGSKMSEDELIATTEALLRGEDPFESGMNRGEGRLLERSIDAQSFPGRGAAASALLGGRTRTAPAVNPPAPPVVEFTDEDILSLAAENPEMSDEDLAELIRSRR